MQRLGNNHGGYHGERIDIGGVLDDIQRAARTHGWRSESFHHTGTFDLLALQRPPRAVPFAQSPRRIYLSTGIHGDEPAGPLAALELLRANRWPATAEIILLPCLNPFGFANNQRENAQRVDLNRDYLESQSPEARAHIAWLKAQAGYDLCLCLHEDWEAHGFYVYELNPDQQPSLAAAMVSAVAPVCPIDKSAVIEGRSAHGGIIRPELDPHVRPLWPESFWLLQHKTRLSYTLEAPSDFPLQVRINALVAGVNAALAESRRPERPS